MSNFLAIATVTATLRRALQTSVQTDVTGANATTLRPDDPALNGAASGVNIFLYQVIPNAAQRNADLPLRNAAGQLVQRPQIGLDLHYLLTCHGSEANLEPQRILGSVMRTLHARPIVTRQMIQDTLADPNFSFLTASDLGNEIETVKFNPLGLSLEELSKLWSVFFETPYRLSVAYQASVVLIELAETPRAILPVQTRSIFVAPSLEGATTPIITPDELPALQLWLKSDAGVTYDSQGVSLWADQSDNGNDALQTVPDNRPAFVGHALGGKPALRFDGVDDYLAITNLQYDAANPISEITVCALVMSESENQQIIASFDRNEYWRLALKDGTTVNAGWDTRDTGGTVDDFRSPAAYTDGNWHLIFGWFSQGETPDKQLFVDTEAVATTTAHDPNALGSGTTRFGFIGVGSEAAVVDGTTGPNRFLAGDLVELIIYHHALSDEERRQLERYFIHRYSG